MEVRFIANVTSSRRWQGRWLALSVEWPPTSPRVESIAVNSRLCPFPVQTGTGEAEIKTTTTTTPKTAGKATRAAQRADPPAAAEVAARSRGHPASRRRRMRARRRGIRRTTQGGGVDRDRALLHPTTTAPGQHSLLRRRRGLRGTLWTIEGPSKEQQHPFAERESYRCVG